MLKSELIRKLAVIEGDFEIVLAKDSEGNWFEKLSDIEVLMYDHSAREVGYAELTDELKAEGYTKEDISQFPEKVIVLWP